MSRAHQKTRVSARLSHTLKRHYVEENESNHSPHGPNVESDDDDHQVEFIVWKLTLNSLDRFSVSLDDEVFFDDDRILKFGRNNEDLRMDGNEVIFRGTTTTRAKLVFILPDGRLSIAWYGGQLIIDDVYSIVEKNITMWHQLPREFARLRTQPIYIRGERADPITLSHANRSYVVRLNDSFPAVVMPRCAYYPLKLALMKDFMSQLGPSNLRERSSMSPERMAEDSRIAPPTPITPRTLESSPNSIVDRTQPTQYIRSHVGCELSETSPANEQSDD